jgi:Fur family ferric uptake transcriptional regulator
MVGELLDYEIQHHSLILYGACNRQYCENKKEVTLSEA